MALQAVKDQVVPTLSTSSLFARLVPSTWQQQTQCMQTYSVSPLSDEWKMCKELVEKTLPVTLAEIVRIQNVWIWENYRFTKERVSWKNNDICNEMYLFHGTGCNSPLEIVSSEDGLDVRHSNAGSWGHAIYLSDSALYSNQFVHTLPTGEKELLIVKAIIGDCYDYGTKKNTLLRYPPVKDRTLKSLNNVRYDSVSGITKGTRVYMLYDNGKVYPAYIVKYSQCTT